MKKVVLIFAAIIFLASLPDIVSIRQGEFFLDLTVPFDLVVDYIKSIKDRDIFIYTIQGREISMLETYPRSFIISLSYLSISLVSGVILGSVLGVLLSGEKNIFVRNIISITGFIPDFIFIIILQILVLLFNNLIGFRLVKVATAGSSHALLLPFVSITLFPFVYVLKTVSMQVRIIKNKSYILFAKSKGLKDIYILFKHIIPGVTPVVKAELPRVTGLVIANLFISERLFNISGVTRFLFYLLEGGQSVLVVNSLFGLVLLFAISYSIALLSLKLISGGFK